MTDFLTRLLNSIRSFSKDLLDRGAAPKQSRLSGSDLLATFGTLALSSIQFLEQKVKHLNKIDPNFYYGMMTICIGLAVLICIYIITAKQKGIKDCYSFTAFSRHSAKIIAIFGLFGLISSTSTLLAYNKGINRPICFQIICKAKKDFVRNQEIRIMNSRGENVLGLEHFYTDSKGIVAISSQMPLLPSYQVVIVGKTRIHKLGTLWNLEVDSCDNPIKEISYEYFD